MTTGEIHSKIAGVTFRDDHSGLYRQTIIRRYVKRGKPLRLVPEPNNPHGAGLALWLDRGGLFSEKRSYHLGYIHSELAKELWGNLKQGHGLEVRVTEVTGGKRDKESLGVNILIRIHK